MSKYTLLSSWLFHARKVIGYWRERGSAEGWRAVRQIKEVQAGELKGMDRAGNQYWEDLTQQANRTRYVVYADRKTANASNVPPEWHGWLHHMNDETPVEFPQQPRQWTLKHQPTTLSRQGSVPNYLPPGHILSERQSVYGSTGAGVSEKLEGTYESWKSVQQHANPEEDRKWRPKTERR